MTRTVSVTPAQVDAAQAVAEWSEATGQPVPDAVRRIASASTRRPKIGMTEVIRRGERDFKRDLTANPVRVRGVNAEVSAIRLARQLLDNGLLESPDTERAITALVRLRDVDSGPLPIERQVVLEVLKEQLETLTRLAQEDGYQSREVFEVAKRATDTVNELIRDYGASRGEPQPYRDSASDDSADDEASDDEVVISDLPEDEPVGAHEPGRDHWR